ncbi:MAG: phosphate acyltransferase PlsX [Thermodesulfovibrionia bacterium]|nr:phosphate acyltransferase PlsX [Thermodesulfovibrionia bacterium]
MRISLDAMGGDHAPATTVQGAVEAVRECKDLTVILVGDEVELGREIAKRKFSSERIIIKHASQVVGMGEPPMTAVRRKKDSSISVALELVKTGEADAMVSAGNSGVVMATALFKLGKIPGVDRPAIATIMPALKGNFFLLIDAGANVDCDPMNLYQFAIMGEAYMRKVFHIENPKVGLLGIGEEDAKGNELTKEAFKLLKNSNFNFIGNVEGKEIYKGEAHVVVCDGFVGNIALKISEGLAEAISKMLQHEISISLSGRIGYLFMKGVFAKFRKKTHYAEYGGAPLLGLNKPCIISHGRSSAKAIKNAIIVAAEYYNTGVSDLISQEFSSSISREEKLASAE